MIKDNRIYFGHGTVVVGSMFSQLIFSEIHPPLEVGIQADEFVKNGDVVLTGVRRSIQFNNYEEIEEFKYLLFDSIINENKRVIEYQGLILDFTEWNYKSYEVVNVHVKGIEFYFAQFMAC